MVQHRLNGLALMYAHKEMELDLAKIIDFSLIYILEEWEWKMF